MNNFKEVRQTLRAIDGDKYKIKVKENAKITNRNQLEKAIQNGETNIEVPIQNIANIKAYFKELYNDESSRYKNLPEIVHEIDETQEEYEKKLRLQRDKDEAIKEETQKLYEQQIVEQSSNANKSVENIDTDPVAEETINDSDSIEELMAQNASCPNFDELDDERQDYSE